jgi:hypothetical protein
MSDTNEASTVERDAFSDLYDAALPTDAEGSWIRRASHERGAAPVVAHARAEAPRGRRLCAS